MATQIEIIRTYKTQHGVLGAVYRIAGRVCSTFLGMVDDVAAALCELFGEPERAEYYTLLEMDGSVRMRDGRPSVAKYIRDWGDKQVLLQGFQWHDSSEWQLASVRPSTDSEIADEKSFIERVERQREERARRNEEARRNYVNRSSVCTRCGWSRAECSC